MKPHPKLLLVDDDPGIGRMLTALLVQGGYKMRWARTGREGLLQAVEERPDVIVLELCLPDLDGFAVLKALREWNPAPVLMLSVRDTVRNRVRALDGGADDYLAKPFAGEELLARLRVMQRDEPALADPPVLVAGPLRVDMGTQAVTVNGERVIFTATEAAIFHVLARHAGWRVSCPHLTKSIWGAEAGAKISDLREFICRIRRKLEHKGGDHLICAEGSVGYRLNLDPQAVPVSDHGS